MNLLWPKTMLWQTSKLAKTNCEIYTLKVNNWSFFSAKHSIFTSRLHFSDDDRFADAEEE